MYAVGEGNALYKGDNNIKNVRGCRDGMPMTIQTRCRDPKIHKPSLINVKLNPSVNLDNCST